MHGAHKQYNPAAQVPVNDLQRHLLAGSVYVSSRLECAISGGLSEASFWNIVLQDIQVSLAYQTRVRLPLIAFDRELQRRWLDTVNLTEQDWIHRAIWLLAKTINYSYGRDQIDVTEGDGSNIEKGVQIWESKRPDTFRPLYFSPADPESGNPFPTFYYTSIGHGTWLPASNLQAR